MIVLKRPVLTEKTTSEYSDQNKVTFEVDLNANVNDAKKALEETYGVTVERVWVINRLGKTKVNRVNRKVQRKSPDRKLMKFKLKKGDSLDMFKV